tara:strand:+ start:4537 stop:5646 length:1110 start_codon:yes stop_codon:yes gene_type:complete
LPDLSPPEIRIFVIGPMGPEPDDQGLPLARHIPNIVTAARQTIAAIPDLPRCNLLWPTEMPGADVPRDVFSNIAHCDLAIADISNASANVFYELAILHAMGVPTMPVTRGGRNKFYLAHSLIQDVADFRVETLKDAFAAPGQDGLGALERMIRRRRDTASNPISTHFNGIHLVNVAAATGLATGQFFNFLQYVLDPGKAFRQHAGRFEKIIVVRPERVGTVESEIGVLEAVFREPVIDKETKLPKLKKDGSPELALPSFWQDDSHHPRDGYFVRHIADVFLDFATPIASLRVSKQYLEMVDYVKRSALDLGPEQVDRDLYAFEQKLIDIYFHTLDALAASEANRCDPTRLLVLTASEIIRRYGPTAPES